MTRRLTTFVLSLFLVLVAAPAAHAAGPTVTMRLTDWLGNEVPDFGHTFNGDLRLSVGVTDPDGDVGPWAITCTVDGAPRYCGPLSAAWDGTPNLWGSSVDCCATGTHTILVRVTDDAANVGQATFHMTLDPDNHVPVVIPGVVTTDTAGNAEINWTVDEDHPEHMKQTCYIDDERITGCLYPIITTKQLTNVTPGPHFLSVTVNDTQNTSVPTRINWVQPEYAAPVTPVPPVVTPQPPVVTPQPPAPALGTFSAPKRVKVNRKGKVSVKFTCAVKQGCAAAAYKLKHGGRTVAKVSAAAGASRTVTVKVGRRTPRTLKLTH